MPTTWFVDYENGTDSAASAGNGDSFATRRKKVSNCGSAVVANGDTIRIMGSPDPTSLGINGAWTCGDTSTYISGSISSTNATPIVITKASHGYVTGDTIAVSGHVTNTNANGIWEINVLSSSTFELLNADGSNSVGNGVGSGGNLRKITNCNVKLASSVTKNVAVCGNRNQKTNWTASANVTCTVNSTTYKEGGECQQIALTSTFTTGLAAYLGLGSTVDFSAYQQLSFWFRLTSGTIPASGALQLKLCSDAAGVTAVDTFDIPTPSIIDRWLPVTVNNGSALGSAIQSIALYVVTDNGAQTILLDNIIACKAASANDSLSLVSLIGKNISTDTFYGIRSINGTRVLLDTSVNSSLDITVNSAFRGYYGTLETVATYKREPIKVIASATLVTPQKSGAAGAVVTYSGGWDATNMSTQTLETWLDGRVGNYNGIDFSGKSFMAVEKLAFVRCLAGCILNSGNNITATLIACNNNYDNGVTGSTVVYNVNLSIKSTSNNNGSGIEPWKGGKYTVDICNGNASYGVSFIQDSSTAIAGTVHGSGSAGVFVGYYNDNTLYATSVKYNMGSGLSYQNPQTGNKIYNATVSNNLNYSLSASSGAILNIYNCTFLDTTPIGNLSVTSPNHFGVYSQNDGGVVGACKNTLNCGIQKTDTAVRHTASGYSWKISPTHSGNYVNEESQFGLPIAQVAVSAGSLVTFKAWLRRTNTGLTARIVCKGYQIAGVDTDVSASMTAAADTWEELTITFTPTAAGVVEIIAECFGGTTYSMYIDDITVTQA